MDTSWTSAPATERSDPTASDSSCAAGPASASTRFRSTWKAARAQMFKEVVFSKAGLVMAFAQAGGLGGLSDTLGKWNEKAAQAPTVNLTTVTLDDLLARAGAPSFIHFISMDIEGAELEALRAFPFDRYRVGAWAIEHNREEPKRTLIQELLASHGYQPRARLPPGRFLRPRRHAVTERSRPHVIVCRPPVRCRHLLSLTPEASRRCADGALCLRRDRERRPGREPRDSNVLDFFRAYDGGPRNEIRRSESGACI